MANRDVIFTMDDSEWIKYQLALAMTKLDLFPLGTVIIENRQTGAPLLTSDGSGANVKALTNQNISDLIANGKPAGYDNSSKTLPPGSPILVYEKIKARSMILAGKQARDDYQNSQSNPLTPNM